MTFYGFQKTSLINFPKKISSVVFTSGCNFHCPYCHNPELVNETGRQVYSEDFILNHLKKQKGKIEGLCITGGEPLIYGENLLNFIDKVKSIDIKVKLDTNGSFPEFLKKANVDYIAMDIKSSLSKYNLFSKDCSIIEKMNLIDKIEESIYYIIHSNIDYEFRTTVVPNLVTLDDIEIICRDLITNSKNYYLNQFRSQVTLDESYRGLKSYPDSILKEMKNICNKHNIPCTIRNNYAI